MVPYLIPYYRLSLWQNKSVTKNGVTYLDEVKICDLGSSDNLLPSDAFSPELTIKDNGELSLNFSIKNNYWDENAGEEIVNPLLQYIIPERKVKLYYDDEWYEFVIKSTEYGKKSKELLVVCAGAQAFELGKQGYSIELDTELENNLNTVFNLGKTIVQNSDWEIIDTNGHIVNDDGTTQTPEGLNQKSDLIQEVSTEYLYKARLSQTINAVKTLDGQDGNTITFDSGTIIYVFASGLTNATNPFNFLVFSSAQYTKYVLKNETIKDATNYSVWVNFKTEANSKGFYLPLINNNEFLSDIELTPLRAEKYVSSPITLYDPITDKYVSEYKVIASSGIPEMEWSYGDTVRRFTEVEYLTPDANTNLISNSSAFLTKSGWANVIVDPGSGTLLSRTSIEPYLIAKDTSATSTPLYESFLQLGFGGAGSTIVQNSYYLNSGFQDHKDYVTGLNKGQSYVLKAKIYQATAGSTTKSTFINNPPITCKLLEYSIDSAGHYKFYNPGEPLISFNANSAQPATWTNGYEYVPLTDIAQAVAGVTYYVRDEDTMIYSPVSGGLDSSKTYYYIDDQYSYLTVLCDGNASYDELFNGDHRFGFFINYCGSFSGTTNFLFVKDFEVFRYIPKKDGTPFLPEEMKTADIDTIYYYYKPDATIHYKELVQFYSSKTDESTGVSPKFRLTYSEKCEKRRSVTAAKSNRYNILTDLCETFECWMKLHVMHNADGSIRLKDKTCYEQLTNSEISQFNSETHTETEPPLGLAYYYKDLIGVLHSYNPYLSEHKLITESQRIAANNTSFELKPELWYETVGITHWVKHNWGTAAAENKLNENTEYWEIRKGFDIAHGWTYFRGRQVKQQEKYITFHSSIGADNFVGFNYATNLLDIKRRIESENVVTKLIVEANNNEYAPNGFCSISTAASNISGESMIYNFNHYINKGFLTKSSVIDDLNTLNSKLKVYNTQLNTLTEQLVQAQTYTSQLYAQVTSYKTATESTTEEITNQNNQLNVITGTNSAFEKFSDGRLNFDEFTEAEDIYTTILRLQATLATYSKLYSSYKTQYDTWLAKQNDLTNTISDYTTTKRNVVAEFELKYAYYIREGTWTSEDYYNAESYYLDALKTGETYAYPKVSYTLSTIDLSGLEEYSNYKFKIGDCTYIQDVELFGYEADGLTPVKQDIAITELKYNLTDPSKNSITIATFENEFVDLFTKFTVATQKLEYREAAYERAANSVNVTTGFSADLLAKAFENNNVTITQKGNNGVVWDANGITLTDSSSPSCLIRLNGGGISVSQNSGESWTPALSASGLNSGLLNNGVLSVNELRIVDNYNNSGFRWDLTGLNAYNFILKGSLIDQFLAVDETKFVRFDRFGIYGYDGINSFIPSTEAEIYNSNFVQFALTWSGLHIKTHHPQSVYAYKWERVGEDNTKIRWYPGIDIEEAIVWTSSDSEKVTVQPNLGVTDVFGLVTGIAVTGGDPVLISASTGDFTATQEFIVTQDDDGQLILSPLAVTSYSGGISIRNNDDLSVNDALNTTRLRLGYLGIDSSTSEALYGLTLFNTEGNLVLSSLSDGTLSLADKLFVTGEYQNQNAKVTIGISGTYSGWLTPTVPIPEEGGTAFARIMDIYRMEVDPDDPTQLIESHKFQLFDDGSLIMPGFAVDSSGNVHLTLSESTFIGPHFKASEEDALTTVSLSSNTLKLTSLDGEDGTAYERKDYTRAELGLTSKQVTREDGTVENIGINPYLRLIANKEQNGQTGDVEPLATQGLLKMFDNGLWLGNGAIRDNNNSTFEMTAETEGLFLEFFNQSEQMPVVFLVHGTVATPISTSTQTTAVFG